MLRPRLLSTWLVQEKVRNMMDLPMKGEFMLANPQDMNDYSLGHHNVGPESRSTRAPGSCLTVQSRHPGRKGNSNTLIRVGGARSRGIPLAEKGKRSSRSLPHFSIHRKTSSSPVQFFFTPPNSSKCQRFQKFSDLKGTCHVEHHAALLVFPLTL